MLTPGIFDILAGLWPRPVMITRIVWPNEHRTNMRFCLVAMMLTILGTLGETVVAFYLYGINMEKWSEAVTWATPFCHVVFMLAQLYSSFIMLSLARKHRRKLNELAAAGQDIEMSDPEKRDNNPALGPDSQEPGVVPGGENQKD